MSRSGLLRSTAVFSAMTLLSRIAGLARDLLQAALFGAGPAVSAFVVAYRIPNYLRRVFAEGSFASAFVDPLVEEGSGRRWVMLVSQELIDPQLPPELFLGEMVEPVQNALAAAIVETAPGIDGGDARLASQSLMGQLLHLVNLHRCPRTGPPPVLAQLVDHTVRFSAAGIRSLQRIPA